ncbi:histone deacetylase 5 [Oryza brachyantha]|nr:histone deacetylase 5 [Oryza brachyantha]XP_015695171.1 histone deacetylase 5 [Oryza brachyantha]
MAFVNVIQITDGVISESLSKLRLEDKIAMTATSSNITVEQSPTDLAEPQNFGSAAVSKEISSLSFTWRSELSKVYVWYASFGSNMWTPRFLCYIHGGKAEGMNIPCFGSHDPSPPSGTMWKTVPHRLFFGRSSTTCWGIGGVGFLNPETNPSGNSYVCTYKITLEQFNDALFRESFSE